jgi:hypothetical protein
MKKLLLLLLIPVFSFAQEDEDEYRKHDTFTLTINQDNVFGFYPSFGGSIPFNRKWNFTYYSVFWTNFSYSINGINNWLEAGMGVSYVRKRFTFNPSIGTTHGGVLSGAKEGKLLEGIVPAVLLSYNGDRLETDFSGAWYKSVRNYDNNANDSFWGCANLGLKITPKISFGFHDENNIRTNIPDFYKQNILEIEGFNVLGGYLKFVARDRYIFKFTGAKNISHSNDIYSHDFYRLEVVTPLF